MVLRENKKVTRLESVAQLTNQSFVIAGVLELFAVSQGVIGIRGVFSDRFLAMNKKGRLHATVSANAMLR